MNGGFIFGFYSDDPVQKQNNLNELALLTVMVFYHLYYFHGIDS
jgi:hypothetical protein